MAGGGAMSVELRHYCRNLKCRSKLPAPIDSVRKAFCCRGCHSAFYRTRCLVCEKDTGTNPLTGEKRKRLVGRYHLQKPIAIPRQAWAHLEEAKRGAESFALIILDLPAGFLRRRLAP
jgi:hypothetical protein